MQTSENTPQFKPQQTTGLIKNESVYIGSTDTNNNRHVIVRRGDAVYDLNPRFNLRNHSPTGINWGYGGSGPCQLAVALLADYFGNCELGDRLADTIYQLFKWHALAPLEADSWTWTRTDVAALLREVWVKNESFLPEHVDNHVVRPLALQIAQERQGNNETYPDASQIDKCEEEVRRQVYSLLGITLDSNNISSTASEI